MNEENVKREYTKEELAAISARMKAQITADDIVEIINGFSGPTIPAEQFHREMAAMFPGEYTVPQEVAR
jgi:hypothetical protein